MRTQLFSISSDTAKTKTKPMCKETSVINSVARMFFLLQTFCLKWYSVRELTACMEVATEYRLLFVIIS
jgi:hypothetical protein